MFLSVWDLVLRLDVSMMFQGCIEDLINFDPKMIEDFLTRSSSYVYMLFLPITFIFTCTIAFIFMYFLSSGTLVNIGCFKMCFTIKCDFDIYVHNN